MKQETMYPTREQALDAIERWKATSAPDFEIMSIHLMGDSLRRFNVTLSNGALGLRVGITVIPGFNTVGWFAVKAEVYNLDARVTWDYNLDVYPKHLRDLMYAYPQNAIVSIDNEDDAFPVGHPVFGYAVIDERKAIIAFVQHPALEEGYTFNPFLPYAEIVTDENVLETLNDTEAPRIRGEWVDDVKEWWV